MTCLCCLQQLQICSHLRGDWHLCQKKKDFHLFLSLSSIIGEKGKRMKYFVTSRLSFFAIWSVENKKYFLFLFSEGKGMKPCFPIQTVISGTVLHMAVFEIEVIECNKRSGMPKLRVGPVGKVFPLIWKRLSVCAGADDTKVGSAVSVDCLEDLEGMSGVTGLWKAV